MPYERLRAATQADLGAFLEPALTLRPWSIQRDIATATSVRRARVDVPSCNSSGKTTGAAGLALAFYWAFTPGEPCILCGGPCRGSKVVATSSREGQLEDVLFSELRTLRSRSRVPIPGEMPPREMRLWDGGEHFLKGHAPASPEGWQGYHSSGHLLVIGDEATSIPEEMSRGIATALASGDARMLLIYNPTTEDTWAYNMHTSARFRTIRIRAWDTPNLARLTNEEIKARWGVELDAERVPVLEEVPPGAELLDPDFLDELVSWGQGPGSYEWQTRIEAMFWGAGSSALVPPALYDSAADNAPRGGPTVFGIDLAAWGDSECVCLIRQGNVVRDLVARSGLRGDQFFEHVVPDLLREWKPELVIFDADGPGAGAYTTAERVVGRNRLMAFRGSLRLGHPYFNLRSQAYWSLKQRFEGRDIVLALADAQLRKQLTGITYKIENGLIKIDQKQKIRDRIGPIDRADALAYAFASEAPTPRVWEPEEGVSTDASEEEFWKRQQEKIREGQRTQGFRRAA